MFVPKSYRKSCVTICILYGKVENYPAKFSEQFCEMSLTTKNGSALLSTGLTGAFVQCFVVTVSFYIFYSLYNLLKLPVF